MSIAGAQSIIEANVLAALSFDAAALAPTVATLIIAAVASAAPLGLYPPSPPPVFPSTPVAPVGVAPATQGMTAALSMGPAAEEPMTAQLMAVAVASLAPAVPPAGLSLLQSDIETALSFGPAADPQTFAQLFSIAVVNYYQMAGVL